LRFSEEHTALTDRFREVEIIFDSPPSVPDRVPPEWMHLNSSPAVIFVDSNFNAAETEALTPGTRPERLLSHNAAVLKAAEAQDPTKGWKP